MSKDPFFAHFFVPLCYEATPTYTIIFCATPLGCGAKEL